MPKANGQCFACAVAESERDVLREHHDKPRADTPFVAALVEVERHGLDRIVSSLCHNHRRLMRTIHGVADGVRQENSLIHRV